MGSSAGAGSGEFHVYRHLRRKEYARQKHLKMQSETERLNDEYQQRLENNQKKADDKTSKKRAKRLRQKKNAKEHSKKPKLEDEKDVDEESEKSEEESEKSENETDDTNDVTTTAVIDAAKDESNDNTSDATKGETNEIPEDLQPSVTPADDKQEWNINLVYEIILEKNKFYFSPMQFTGFCTDKVSWSTYRLLPRRRPESLGVSKILPQPVQASRAPSQCPSSNRRRSSSSTGRFPV